MTEASQFTETEWIKFLGIDPVSAAEGKAVIRMRPQPVHLNHNGTVNAAVLYGLAAAVCGSDFGRFAHAPLANEMSMRLGPLRR